MTTADDTDKRSSPPSSPTTIQHHVFDQLNTFLSPAVDAQTKVSKAKSLEPFIKEVDGYLSISGDDTQGQLPAIEWNTNFRKAYTFLMWVRPRLGQERESTIQEDDISANSSKKRILYKFSTAEDDENGQGVCVTVGTWHATQKDSNQTSGRTIKTSITAFSLPKAAIDAPMGSVRDDSSPYVTADLELVEDEWALIGITHVFPYLKRPHWTICVNGRVQGAGELNYPVLEGSPIMGNNSMLCNIVAGGATLHDEEADMKMTASDLQNQFPTRLNMSLHLASFCLSREPLSSTIQALLAQGGPALALQHNGALPLLPPVANWTKGSSLEGPNVGIPIAVHGQALQLQQLASTCVLWGSAIETRLLGAGEGHSHRIICRMPVQRGTTYSAPRVGLIQPTPPNPERSRDSESDDEVTVSLTMLGSCSIHHNLTNYLLQASDAANVDTRLSNSTRHFSLVLEGQSLDSHMLLPFFLALPPPGTIWDLQKEIYRQSLNHLYALYSNGGELAATLLNVFTTSLLNGGGRCHEQVLQNGSLHVLTSSLRQSLVRAEVLNVAGYDTLQAFEKAHFNNTKTTTTMSVLPKSPRRIPPAVADACVRFLDACCGPPSALLEELSPAMQIQRTSDIALTALFGVALDLELWGRNLAGCAKIIEAVAERYGGACVTAGYIIRSQISVQYLLDLIRCQLDREIISENLERIADAFSKILQAMLLSSLSNKRSVSQGENDISACMGALSDCPFGSVGAHVIFNAIMGVLGWCEVYPSGETARPSTIDEEHKMQVVAKLARNLLMAQFHDVVAPMLLARTVFSGERTMKQDENVQKQNASYSGPLSWKKHWQLCIQAFAWVTSVAGPDGIDAAKSLGKLLLASGLAGSLQGALDDSGKDLVSNLFLPPPTMALTLAASGRQDEWSYSDVLSDRLEVMMPLLPGLVVSLLSHASDVNVDQGMSQDTLDCLGELMSAVGGAFYRVYGGATHSTSLGSNQKKTSKQKVDHVVVTAAKDYAHYFLMVSMVLESHLAIRDGNTGSKEDIVQALQAPFFAEEGKDASWVNISSTLNESFITDETVRQTANTSDGGSPEAVIATLTACQKSSIRTATELLVMAMQYGGGDVSTLLWRTVLSTLKDSTSYVSREAEEKKGKSADSDESEQKIGNILANDILCRLTAIVLIKSMKRNSKSEEYSTDMSAAVSKLCLLIEEKELISKPLKSTSGDRYSKDQAMLFCALIDILKYGRDTDGWFQLIPSDKPKSAGRKLLGRLSSLTNRNNKNAETPSEESHDADESDALQGQNDRSGKKPLSSKVMLPVLLPCLRTIVSSLGHFSLSCKVHIPEEGDKSTTKEQTMGQEYVLFDYAIEELESTLSSSIMGLSFLSARDVGLHAMAALRRALQIYKESTDQERLDRVSKLLTSIADLLGARHQEERRRRETALFDAYEGDDQPDEEGKSSQRKAAAESMEFEKMMLGGDLIPGQDPKNDDYQQMSFEEENHSSAVDSEAKGEDFILFHDTYTDSNGPSATENKAKMAWRQYEGLGSALEECSQLLEGDTKTESVLKLLSPYLDAWDQNTVNDAAESELVGLFDTILQVGADGSPISKGVKSQALSFGSDTAADSMTSFIEFAAVEKSRIVEFAGSFLPNHRHSIVAFCERFCWARYMELSDDSTKVIDSLWERGVADGNRDIRSRLLTVPCSPQFKRYIPKYLDHGADHHARNDTSEQNEGEKKMTRTNSTDDIDAFTKSLLEAGHVEIKDITKKEVVEEEEEADLMLPAPSEMYDEDDMFDDKPIERPSTGEGSDSGSTDGTATTEDSSEVGLLGNEAFEKMKLGSSHFNITTSAFASPPDNSSSTLSLMHSAAAGMIEQHVENCLHVKAEGSRKCSMLLTSTHLILEYDADSNGLYEGEMLAVYEEAERQRMAEETGDHSGEDDDRIKVELERRQLEIAALRPKSIRFNLSELSHVYLRRYRLRDSSIEMFFIPSGGTSFGGYGLYSPATSLFLDFGPGYEGTTRRDDSAFAIMKRAPPQAIKQWPDRASHFLHEQLNRLTIGWVEGRITNFDYLLHLNMLAGRSYNDTCQYPVMPWVLSNYQSEEIPDLRDRSNFRDLSKPMGALNPERLEDFIERFNTFADPSIPPFMYGSHYSTNAGVVLHFLVRMHPFSSLHRQLQGGHFDVADRLFSSVPRTWEMCTGSSAAEVKELTPEWYCNPSFLKNSNHYKMGTAQDGEVLGDVELPPWAKGRPEIFVEVMRNALESDICSEMLPDWIDLIFGRKQQGPEAIAANNVFFYLTYYGSVDVASIEDEGLRQATELQIAHFGQCPMQLFTRPHVRKIKLHNFRRLSFYQITSAYSNGYSAEGDGDKKGDGSDRVFGKPLYLPFFSAPLSHWVHLDAPPPGPHAPLVSVRLAGTDRCLAVDAQGVFHCFRWAWKAEDDTIAPGTDFPIDDGCFIAQRELARFRSVPRLVHVPHAKETPAVAISKTLFAGRSVLLVLSDGDGRGALAMQLIDPAKASVRGEVVVKSVHSSQITCIATDPIGTAAGHGGVGGELAIVGSADGCASIWRFMSSHYLPLRPRVRLTGHRGHKIFAVGMSAPIHIAATVSAHRCCIHSIGNGNVLRVIEPPSNTLDLPDSQSNKMKSLTRFADTPAIGISVQGFVVTVCETTIKSIEDPRLDRSVITLQLFSLEGVPLGSKPLESWRGIPHKMTCTPDGTAVMVCSGRGVTLHRLSAITPLEFIDEWHITESEELDSSIPRAWDIDLGPSLNRPVIAAAACSNGALRLHALPGISPFSIRHKSFGIGQSVGSALAKPARRFRNAVGKGFGVGQNLVGVGKEIGKEVKSDVKERGVGGFLGGVFKRKSSQN